MRYYTAIMVTAIWFIVCLSFIRINHIREDTSRVLEQTNEVICTALEMEK